MFGAIIQGYNLGRSISNEISNSINVQISNRVEARNAAIREKNAMLANAIEKGISEYHPCPLNCLFDPFSPEQNSIISGGTQIWRNNLLEAIITPYYNCSVPIIVFHQSNQILKRTINTNFSEFIKIDGQNPVYDPIVGLNIMQIANLVLSCNNEFLKINPESSFYFQGLNEFMQYKNVIPSIYAFATIPYMELTTRINHAVSNGRLSNDHAFKIQNLLSRGSSEQSSIQLFFENVLNNNSAVSKRLNTEGTVNISKAISSNNSLLIDLPISTDATMTTLVLSDLKKAVSMNKPFVLVIDDIQLLDNKEFKDFIVAFPESYPLFLLNQDIYSSFGSDENFFNVMVGKINKKLIMKHISAVSAKKWSDVLGEYEHQEIEHSYGHSTSFNTPGVTHNTSTSKRKENRVAPQSIIKMTDDEVYISDNCYANIAHMQLIG